MRGIRSRRIAGTAPDGWPAARPGPVAGPIRGHAVSAGEVIVNGRSERLTGVSPHTNALDWLRGVGLTGAKEGCAEGECGACAVLVARPGTARPTDWVAVNSCLMPAALLDGQEVVTVEGLGTPDSLHPVQHELAERGGSQCGYCTPGFVCGLAAEYYRADGAAGFDLDALSGNLCRCTGYRPIRDAALALGTPTADDPLAARCHHPPPPEAAGRLALDGLELVRPTSLDEAIALLAEHPDAQVVAGCTDWGVDVNLKGARSPLLLALDQVAELRVLTEDDEQFVLGAGIPLADLGRRLAGRVPLIDLLLPRFASRPIRNAATLGGNLATASPIGDAAPVLLALAADLVLAGPDGRRILPLDQFFTGYRTTALRPGELIVAARIPRPLAPLVGFEKVAKRHVDDISSVAVAFALEVVDGHVERVRIGLGGVAATPIRPIATEQALHGHPWDADTVGAAAATLEGEGSPLDDHRASAAYRRAMLGQALRRLFVDSTAGVVVP